MSRSRKRTPMFGITTAPSEKADKLPAHEAVNVVVCVDLDESDGERRNRITVTDVLCDQALADADVPAWRDARTHRRIRSS